MIQKVLLAKTIKHLKRRQTLYVVQLYVTILCLHITHVGKTIFAITYLRLFKVVIFSLYTNIFVVDSQKLVVRLDYFCVH